jgi:para-nitrobenzyl esterase
MKRFFGSAVGLSALVLAILVVPSAADGADPLTVHTSAGDVQGISSGSLHEWRGVPYAAPPLGPRRWRPPAPVSPWSGVRLADTFAPQCLQLGLSEPVEGSEDCLYLNVFAPAEAGGSRPVMVHLHGGSNFFFHPYTNANALVERGVIVVTVGYRLGVFGFAGHPALTAEGGGSSGEYGLLDQIAALQWVQDNIAAFGGDPGNVTLFGESAGSFDAVAIAASPWAGGCSPGWRRRPNRSGPLAAPITSPMRSRSAWRSPRRWAARTRPTLLPACEPSRPTSSCWPPGPMTSHRGSGVLCSPGRPSS